MRSLKHFLYAIAFVAALTACQTPKDIAYIQNLNSGQSVSTAPINEITAQPGDRVSIVVHSQDAQLAEIFNLPIQSRRIGTATGRQSTASAAISIGNNSGQTAPYIVDSFGDIDFPVLGPIHVAGMTRQQIAKTIKDELISRRLLKDPTVVVEFLDHSFTVLGSVGQPGRIIFDRDRLTLVEAIGLAGDLTIDGQRTNVKVLRTEEGKEQAYEVDLTDANSLFQSPVYYIQQNDIIYVEPNDKRKRETTSNGNTPFTPSFWISLASFGITVALLFIK
ncbi:MAG: polysaccharide biosynthesis/export family protein [Muribaculaceae bacterium]|nr:polysaccharide biosynthesis/export family protein [Muribaculaceae bacterium]